MKKKPSPLRLAPKKLDLRLSKEVDGKRTMKIMVWLVASTHLKNMNQNGNLPQIEGENFKNYLKPPPSGAPPG